VRRYLAINWLCDHDTDEIAGQAVEIAIDVCQIVPTWPSTRLGKVKCP
jgi:hypothetical protein